MDNLLDDSDGMDDLEAELGNMEMPAYTSNKGPSVLTGQQ